MCVWEGNDVGREHEKKKGEKAAELKFVNKENYNVKETLVIGLF